MTFKVRYGIDVAERTATIPPTVRNLKQDESLKAELGFGDNIRVLIDGVIMGDEVIIPDGSSICIETACNTKQTVQ